MFLAKGLEAASTFWCRNRGKTFKHISDQVLLRFQGLRCQIFWIRLRWFSTLYHGKSLSNHSSREYFVTFSKHQTSKSKIWSESFCSNLQNAGPGRRHVPFEKVPSKRVDIRCFTGTWEYSPPEVIVEGVDPRWVKTSPLCSTVEVATVTLILMVRWGFWWLKSC